MKKLILHSDHIEGKTQLDETILKWTMNLNPRIAYIPSQSDTERKFFQEKADWYKQLGIEDLLYFDIDREYDEQKKGELLTCDAIFLSGGDTSCFLSNMKKRHFIPFLRDYVKRGGILIGVSAGSILMSETINMTHINDKKQINTEKNTSLGLVDFEFYPHLNFNRENSLRALTAYSLKNPSVIYACNDGDGIIVDGEKLHFIGDVLRIEKGVVTSAS